MDAEKIKEELRDNAYVMSEIERSECYDQRLKEAKLHELKDSSPIDYTKPFLMNLNEDPVLNGKLNASLAEGYTNIN